MTPKEIRARIGHCLVDAHFPQLPNFQRGKVRDSYDLPDGRRVMIATDRQSAFDHVLAAVPFKGEILNQTARFWFEATADICANHVVAFPDANVVVGRKLKMLPIEMVVRDYLTGSTATSIWPMYAKGERVVYGHKLPGGLKKNQKLPETILTPTTKGMAGEHDYPITAAEIVEKGILAESCWKDAAETSLRLFARGREIAAKNGLILVDTKYEFGIDPDGRLTLADEVHTPDSSRYWVRDSYDVRMAAGQEPESLDKEFLRLWIAARCDPYKDPIPEIPSDTLAEFSGKYIRLYEQVTGRTFEPSEPDLAPRQRIEKNLRRAFPEYFK